MGHYPKIIFAAVSIILGVGLSGCAQGIAENAGLASKPLAKSQTRLKIFRADAYVAGAVGARVKIDGRQIAEIDNGGSTILDLAAGKHEIEVDTWQHPNVYKLNLDAKPGTMYVLEITPREEAVAAGMFGLVGMLAEAAVNENGGTWSIRVVEEKRI
jgi:hypothetical protein